MIMPLIRLSIFGWNLVLFIWTFGFVFFLIFHGLKEAIQTCKEQSNFFIFGEYE